jgi:hypothetical protein
LDFRDLMGRGKIAYIKLWSECQNIGLSMKNVLT